MPHDVPTGGNVPVGVSLLSANSKEEFANCLRDLRVQAGTPSFRQLAKVTHYSSSTLADATTGRRLPTEAVVSALVTACGADPVPWLDRLRQVAAAEQRSGPDAFAGQGGQDRADAAVAAAGTAAGPAVTRRRPGHRLPGVVIAGALGALGTGLAIGWMGASASSAPATQSTAMALAGVPAFSGNPAPAPTGEVMDGTDPNVGGCTKDSRLVDRVPVLDGGVQIGALDLRYSPRCGAGWAKLYLYPGQPIMMGAVTVRSGDDRFSTIANPLIGQVDNFTDVIVPGAGGCLGAGGTVYQAGRQVVTAVIPCQAPAPG